MGAGVTHNVEVLCQGEPLTVMSGPKDRAAGQTRRVVLYARVSSKDQEKEGFSIPAQLRLLREYATKQGLVIDHEFTDIETAKVRWTPSFGQNSVRS